jgi:hypothetical protein
VDRSQVAARHGLKVVHGSVREIVITLQTIGPGQYETPQISSSSIRFKGSYFPREQNPGGPRQVYRFVAETVGEAKSERNAVYRIIVQVKAN